MGLVDWLTERRDNCLQIAKMANENDLAGWIEDADYFEQAIRAATNYNPNQQPGPQGDGK